MWTWREMKLRLATGEALMAEAEKALDECGKKVDVKTAIGGSLASAIRIIRTELHPSTVQRLDAFLGQVREVERQQGRGKTASQTPENLLSLAITGWLLGSPSSEAAPDVAINLWKTRQMVLEYLRETGLQQRQKILENYRRDVVPTVDLDEIVQLIDHLPPVEPAIVTPGVTVVRRARQRQGSLQLSPPSTSRVFAYPAIPGTDRAAQQR